MAHGAPQGQQPPHSEQLPVQAGGARVPRLFRVGGGTAWGRSRRVCPPCPGRTGPPACPGRAGKKKAPAASPSSRAMQANSFKCSPGADPPEVQPLVDAPPLPGTLSPLPQPGVQGGDPRLNPLWVQAQGVHLRCAPGAEAGEHAVQTQRGGGERKTWPRPSPARRRRVPGPWPGSPPGSSPGWAGGWGSKSQTTAAACPGWSKARSSCGGWSPAEKAPPQA